ncbi:MAG: type II toxin-antitoxin system RelE/ParE family toxin [Desulfuromonadales bacterium]|nr:type II toxin-antitoxin system RelE/ParE family toxin [Desulfuromonadales bacterium]
MSKPGTKAGGSKPGVPTNTDPLRRVKIGRRWWVNFQCRLTEVRSKLANRVARVIFCTHGPQIILLHGFIMKTQEIPDDDMRLAKKRKAEIDGN